MAIKALDAFPALQTNASSRQTLKKLPRNHELSAIIVSFFGTIRGATTGSVAAFNATSKPNTGAAAGGSSDALTIINKIVKQIYLKRDGVEKAYNLTPLQAAILYGFQYQRWMLAQSSLVALRDGDQIPAYNATAKAWRIDLVFSFLLPWAETPNKFAPGTEQALLDGGWEVTIDADLQANWGTTLALVNGNADVTLTKVTLNADITPTPYAVWGPLWDAQAQQETTENYERVERAIYPALYATELPTALDAAVTAITLKRDGLEMHEAAIPSQIADAAAREWDAIDGVNGFDPTRSCTPLLFGESRKKADELEYPIFLQRLNVFFQGSSATRNMIRHRIQPLEKTSAVGDALCALVGVNKTWRDLPVRFPGGKKAAVIDALFASRFVA